MVVILYVIMICRIFLIGRQAEKQKQFFMGYIAYGFGLIFAAQALINIGVNVGALPTKGLTLPLLSYGGSSLLVCAAMISIVMRIDFELKTLRYKELFDGSGAPAKEPSKQSIKQPKLRIVKENGSEVPQEVVKERVNDKA